MRKMKAAIFDMDGTLIDSMPQWRKLNSVFVRMQGIEPTPEQEAALYAMSGMMVINYCKEHFGIETDYEQINRLACGEMERIYSEGLPLKPGADRYLDRLHERGVMCVLATATPARQALVALNRKHLVRKLDAIFSTEMFSTYKGETAFYDELCGFIGVAPEDCVMFEDGLYAMTAAKAAGLGVVGITDSTNEHCRDQMQKTADLLIDSYDELP